MPRPDILERSCDFALGEVEHGSVDLPEAFGREGALIRPRQIREHPVLPRLVDELEAARRLVLLETLDELEAAVDGVVDCEVVVGDLLSELSNDGILVGLSRHQTSRITLATSPFSCERTESPWYVAAFTRS